MSHQLATLASDDSLKILTWNCNNIHNTVLTKLHQLLSDNSLDLAILIETKVHPNTMSHLPTFIASSPATQRLNSNSLGGGICMLGSTRLRNAFVRITESTTSTLTIQLSNGFEISGIYAPPGTMTLQGFKSMLNKVKNSDYIAGDFNCPPPLSSTQIHKHSTSTTTKQRLAALVLWSEVNLKTLGSTPTSGITSHLDHVWTSSRITTQTFIWKNRTESTTLGFRSDHGTLWHTIDNFISNPAYSIPNQTNATRFHTNKLSDDKTRKTLIEEWKTLHSPWTNSLHNIDQQVLNHAQTRKLVDNISDAMDQSIISACQRILGSYDVNGSRVFSNKTELAKELASMSQSTSASQIFKRACRTTSATLVPTSDKPVMQEATNLFEQLYFDDDIPQVYTSDSPLNIFFSSDNIQKTIHSYSDNKTAGHDGIHQRTLKTLIQDPLFLDLLTKTFNTYLKLQTTPSQWNETLVYLLPKQEGHECPIDKTRPISLTLISRRIFEKLLMQHFESSDEKWLKLHTCQGGFRQGRSTDAHILLSHLAVTAQENPCRLQVFLDIEKAFDRIRHHYIIDSLNQRGTPQATISLLYSLMLHNTSSRILVNHSISAPIRRTRGILQGSILSPLLFNIMIDQLAREIQPTTTPFPTLLLFADDIKIQLPGYKLAETQTILDQCEDWAYIAGLKFGIKKCATIGLRIGDKLTIHDQPIAEAPDYKYLGVTISKLGINWSKLITGNIGKAESSLKFLLARAKTGVRNDIRVELVRSFVRSNLCHAMGLWSLYSSCKLPQHERIQTNQDKEKLKRLFELERTYLVGTSVGKDTIYSMCNMESDTQFMKSIATSTATRLLSQPQSSPLHSSFTTKHDKSSILHSIKSHETAQTALTQAYPKQWLKNERRKTNHAENLKSASLVSYISLHCRSKMLDSVLTIAQAETRNIAIRWRLNQLLNSSGTFKCHCGLQQDIHRNHFNSCDAFRRAGLIPLAVWQSFTRHQAHRRHKRLQEERQGAKFKFDDKITILDYLLNRHAFKMFADTIAALAIEEPGLNLNNG